MKKTMWCAALEDEPLTKTISETKDEVHYKLFLTMSQAFQSKYWKKLEPSKRALRKLGYKTIKVAVLPLAELSAIKRKNG